MKRLYDTNNRNGITAAIATVHHLYRGCPPVLMGGQEIDACGGKGDTYFVNARLQGRIMIRPYNAPGNVGNLNRHIARICHVQVYVCDSVKRVGVVLRQT